MPMNTKSDAKDSRFALITTTLMVVALLLTTTAPVLAQGVWVSKASIPTSREGYGAAEVGGIFYYVAGYQSGETRVNEAYDPTTDIWTTKAPIPGPGRSETVAVSDGRYLYLIGGRIFSANIVLNELLRYDPATDTWISLAPMPTPRVTEHMAVYYNGKIYVIGGRSKVGLGFGALAVVEIYDIATNNWSVGRSLPEARSDAVAIEHDGKIYVFGGFDKNRQIRNTTFIYDIATDSWTVGAPLPEPRANPVGGKCGNRIHVIGGLNQSEKLTTTNYVYDPAANSWTISTPIPSPTAEVQGISYRGKIHVVGGGIQGSGSNNDRHYVFSCNTIIQVEIDIKPGSYPNAINPNSRSVIPVAILTTNTFDASDVNPGTVKFGQMGTEASPIRWAMEDVDGDSDLDMILHFRTQDTEITMGDTEAKLTGKTWEDIPIEGADSIITVPR